MSRVMSITVSFPDKSMGSSGRDFIVRLIESFRSLSLLLTSLLIQVVMQAESAASEDEQVPAPYASYVSEGIQYEGARITRWDDAVSVNSPRSLTRVFGKPRPFLVQTSTGRKTVVRFNGRSAIWQAVDSWGTLNRARTIVMVVRVSTTDSGVLFDGSTRAGQAPAKWMAGSIAGSWEPKATINAVPVAEPSLRGNGGLGVWEICSFEFSDQKPLGGFIVGANVATEDGLECDVAEVHVFPDVLTPPQSRGVAEAIADRWKNVVDVPPDQQPDARRLSMDPEVFRTTVRENGADGIHTYRIPGLATSTKGTLIAVFDARRRNSADLPGDIDVAMTRSVDQGATWSPLQRIMDFDSAVEGAHGNGVGDPAILVDRTTGRIIVAALWSKGPRAWNGSGPGLAPDETGQFVLVHSDDDGVTWSPPRSITSQIKDPEWRLCFNGPGNGIQLRDGTLVFPAQFKQDQASADGGKIVSVPHSCFIASGDGGDSWSIVPAAIPNGIPTSECAIAELDDGALLLSMRDESRSGQRAWARWEWTGNVTNGRWSQPWMTVIDPTCMASLIRHPDGPLLFSNPNDAKRRISLTVRASTDGGVSWSKGRTIDPAGAMYSCMTVLSDGRIGMLYESVEDDGLVFVRFPLQWVTEAK